MIDFDRESLTDWFGFRVNVVNQPLPRPGIYRFTNLINGKCYVGISVDLYRRCRDHDTSGSFCRKFKAGLRRHGRSSFLLEPLFYTLSPEDVATLPSLEADKIKEHNSVVDGYNIRTSSEYGGLAGEEFSAAISASWRDPTKKDRRLGLRAAWQRPETIAAHANGRIAGTPKQSATMKKKFEDPEVHARHVANITTPAARAKLSASLREYFSDEANREKARQTFAAHADEHSAALRAAWARRPRGWITNGNETRYVFKDEPVPEGWRTGRHSIYAD